jgi:hypothetical protein
MRSWLTLIALIVIGLTWLYTQATPIVAYEGYANYIRESDMGGFPDGDELAMVGQAPPLADMLTLQPGLTTVGYGGTAAFDPKRELELNGQYVQRTNNYLRTSPDNGTAPFNELVGAIYGPKDAINTSVPCWGGGYCLTA